MNAPEQAPIDVIHENNFIVIYQGLDKELCASVVALFDQDDRKARGKVGRAGRSFRTDDTKVSWDLDVPNDGVWKDAFQKFHPRIEACISDYVARSPILKSFQLQATGYKIQMYPQNEGYFRWHADSVGEDAGDRLVAMVLYLNDVEKGGETEFYHQGMKISPKAGRLVLFPAGWNYMHCGHSPESGDKYIISTFIKAKHRH